MARVVAKLGEGAWPLGGWPGSVLRPNVKEGRFGGEPKT